MSVLKSDKGRLVLDFSYKSVRCREYLGLDDTKEGRATARRIRTQVDGEIVAGTFDFAKWFPKSKKARTMFVPPPLPPPVAPEIFGAFARDWLDRQKKLGSTHAYHLDRVSLLETHLIPFFGADRLLSSFTIADVERFLGHLSTQKGLKAATLGAVRINKARALLSKLLDRAVKDGLRKDNPVLEVGRLRQDDEADIDPLSWAEIGLLLDKGFKHDPEMRRFYVTKTFTGLRTSEIIGVKWDDVDWTSTPPTVYITRSFTKHDGEHPTKTKGSKRYVDLRPPVVQALKEQKTASRLRSDFIFCNSLGGALDRDNLANRVWHPALRRAEIRKRTEYQTRHTFATLALSSGEDIGWVAKQLGHKNIEMVIRHYFKYIPNLTRRDGSAFDKAAAQAGL